MTEIYKSIEVSQPQEFPFKDQSILVYRAAFAGYPWHESLSLEEVENRLQKQLVADGFEGIWLVDKSNKLIAATWWTTPSLEALGKEKGEKLRDFVETTDTKIGGEALLIWINETLVSPEQQGKGVAKYIKELTNEFLLGKAEELNRPLILTTRMRDDNYAIIKVNEKFGMERTGIKVPSSQVPGLYHEYWYKVVKPSQNE